MKALLGKLIGAKGAKALLLATIAVAGAGVIVASVAGGGAVTGAGQGGGPPAPSFFDVFYEIEMPQEAKKREVDKGADPKDEPRAADPSSLPVRPIGGGPIPIPPPSEPGGGGGGGGGQDPGPKPLLQHLGTIKCKPGQVLQRKIGGQLVKLDSVVTSNGKVATGKVMAADADVSDGIEIHCHDCGEATLTASGRYWVLDPFRGFMWLPVTLTIDVVVEPCPTPVIPRPDPTPEIGVPGGDGASSGSRGSGSSGQGSGSEHSGGSGGARDGDASAGAGAPAGGGRPEGPKPVAPGPDCVFLHSAGPFGTAVEANGYAASISGGTAQVNGVTGVIVTRTRIASLPPLGGEVRYAIWVDVWLCFNQAKTEIAQMDLAGTHKSGGSR